MKCVACDIQSISWSRAKNIVDMNKWNRIWIGASVFNHIVGQSMETSFFSLTFQSTERTNWRKGFSRHVLRHIRIHVKCHLFCPADFFFLGFSSAYSFTFNNLWSFWSVIPSNNEKQAINIELTQFVLRREFRTTLANGLFQRVYGSLFR